MYWAFWHCCWSQIPWVTLPCARRNCLDRFRSERLSGRFCSWFRSAFGSGWEARPLSVQFTGLIDASRWYSSLCRRCAVSCCCGCSVRSHPASVQALKFIDEATLGQALGVVPAPLECSCSSLFCCRWCSVTPSSWSKRSAWLSVSDGWRCLLDDHVDHRGLRRWCSDGAGAAGLGGDALGFRHHCYTYRHSDRIGGGIINIPPWMWPAATADVGAIAGMPFIAMRSIVTPRNLKGAGSALLPYGRGGSVVAQGLVSNVHQTAKAFSVAVLAVGFVNNVFSL